MARHPHPTAPLGTPSQGPYLISLVVPVPCRGSDATSSLPKGPATRVSCPPSDNFGLAFGSAPSEWVWSAAEEQRSDVAKPAPRHWLPCPQARPRAASSLASPQTRPLGRTEQAEAKTHRRLQGLVRKLREAPPSACVREESKERKCTRLGTADFRELRGPGRGTETGWRFLEALQASPEVGRQKLNSLG